jgi:hypothetical protein
MNANRRVFLLSAAALGSVACTGPALAASPALDAKDPQAVALGYTPDSSKVAAAFAARHAAGAHCGNCVMYQGKGEAQGGCLMFGGKLVPNKGWCGNWVKKD